MPGTAEEDGGHQPFDKRLSFALIGPSSTGKCQGLIGLVLGCPNPLLLHWALDFPDRL